jgi:sec-independent protein translocase protein TatA
MRPEGWHILIIIVLAIVLFGAPKLPGIARSVGQSLRIFRSEVRQLKEEDTVPEARTAPGDNHQTGTPGVGHVPSGAAPEGHVSPSRSARAGTSPGTP